MKTKLLTFALLLISISAGAQTPVSVSVSDDCSQNGKKTDFRPSGTENDYTWVNLGLSVKWATMNVGATTPKGSGYYFAWGETSEKSEYSWSIYKYCKGLYDTMTKYCTNSDYGTVDNKITLEAEDDAAHVNWGGNWRMPTDAEWTELLDQCTWKWTTQNNTKGYLVTSKKAGYTTQSIFLPAAGCRDDAYLLDVGSCGNYWSSSLSEGYSYCACYVGFDSDRVGRSGISRSYGQSVRPVCSNTSNATTLTLYAEGCDTPNTCTCNAGQQISVSATPMPGRHFVKWSDGNTDNPRLITVDKDLTYTAIFAMDYEGKCGDNLSWQYANQILTITGTGAMYDYTSSTMPWLLFCDSITKVIVPDGCTTIGDYAFSGCSGLTSVTIPQSVTSIGSSAFSDCNNIKSVIWNAKNCTSYNFGSQIETLVFGDSVEVIPANICENMTQLSTITIPSSVQSIGNNAFKNCTGINELKINNGLTTIGDYAFYCLSDKNLKTITLPNSVETIGQYAFAECSYLKTITLGAKLEDIDEYAFQNDERLIYVNCYAEEPPVLQENAFDNYDIYLQVPCEVLDEYKVAKGWKLFNRENVSCLSAEGKTLTSDQITVTPSANDATFTWPANDKAEAYSLEITKDGVVFCTLKFNALGQLIGIAFAPGRNGNHHAPAAVLTTNGWQFTVTGLDQASKYAYTLDVTDAGKQVIKSYKGEFATDGYTDLLTLPYDGKDGIGSKFIQNGQLFILRDGKTYTMQGTEIK